jgi:polyhydroxybutyrate depolymerase
VVSAVLILAACGDDSSDESSAGEAPATTTSAGPATTTAALCAGHPDPTPREQALESEGEQRTYLVDVPPSYTGEEPATLILNFHGFGSSAQQQAAYSDLADSTDAIVVAPDGLGAPEGWSLLPGPANPDIAFALDLVAAVSRDYCVDPERIHATGISNGSALSAEIACAAPQVFASVALVAATVPPVLCDPATRVPVLAFHGTADRVVPYAGGEVASVGLANGITVPPAEEAMQRWAEQNGCPGPPHETPGSDVTSLRWDGCEADVELYRVEGAGHVWPGASSDAELESRLGPNTDTINASAVISEWFEDHPHA